ncbi:hypothetical protein EST62_07470 [Chlorobaculum sp. 24CR]|uniref:hypothetical protein n=1 Tax=Chlorobaculum sp. 24CR TaxID=2508878 RepID=UPI00100B445B|nr:hypothetical protein [Chlorobaculum sp. 24CR]RXK85119.1 hypothetical protein EST62_07470 [Chlorobaculum sp. 24CR]
MKKFIFLFIVIELTCATQAFTANASNEAINRDSREIVTFAESSIDENDVYALNSVSRSDAGSHSPHATNSIRVSPPASIKPKKSLVAPHDQPAINGGQSVDLSEPSSIILLGVGTAIAILAKWLKSLKLSLKNSHKTSLNSVISNPNTRRKERNIRSEPPVREDFNCDLSRAKQQSKRTIIV